MNFINLFLTNQYVWLIISSFFMGGMLNCLSRMLKNNIRPRRKQWYQFFTYLFLTISLILLFIIIIICGLSGLLHWIPWVFWVVITGISFLMLRFKLAAGIPGTLVTLVMVILVSMLVYSLDTLTDEEQICLVEITDVSKGKIDLEWSLPGHLPKSLTIQGRLLSPVVEVVIFDDLYLFLGAKTRYRFLGFTAFIKKRGKYIQTDPGFYFNQPEGISGKLFRWYQEYEEWIPGIKSVQVDMDLKKVKKQHLYSLSIQADGGIQILDVTKQKEALH